MSRSYPPDWLDIEAAAYATSLPVSTFRHYVNAGLLPEAVKIGKHALWSREEVSSALASLGAGRGCAMSVLYNEIDHGAAAALQAVMEDGLIPAGHLDTRSIKDFTSHDFEGVHQFHTFAGAAEMGGKIGR